MNCENDPLRIWMLCKPKESWDLLIPKSFMLVFFHTSGQTLLCRPCFVMPIFGLMVSQSGSSAWVSSLWSHHPVFLFFFKGKLLRCYTHTHVSHIFGHDWIAWIGQCEVGLGLASMPRPALLSCFPPENGGSMLSGKEVGNP